MASIMELLEQLNIEEAAVSTADLASKLKASKEGTLKQLNREKGKGNVDGNSQEGWLLTEKGRSQLEKGEFHPTMLDEEVTPRQQFEAIGRRIGIKEDRVVLATDLVWSGDYEDVIWVWKALGREGADLADDLKRVWANSWRAKLHKGIPPELETELTGLPQPGVGEGKGEIQTKAPARDFIIADEQPIRVGPNLGDYSLQDAKDILAIRALKSRFSGVDQSGRASPPGAVEKVSEVLSALEPYINKGSDMASLKEILSDKLALQRQEILSQIPQQGQPAQPKSFIEQITTFVAAIGSLKEAGPMLRSILGITESPPSQTPGLPVQVKGPDGNPVVMDLGQVINYQKFQSEERRADETHGALMGIAKTVRENWGDGVQAIKMAAEQAARGGTGAKPPASTPQPQLYECAKCHYKFSVPDVPFETIACPSCETSYTREQVLGA